MSSLIRRLLLLLVLAAPSSCLAQAGAVPIRDLREISGAWTGELSMGSQRAPIAVTITEDGRASIDIGGEQVTAALRVVNGRVHWEGSRGNAVSTLHGAGSTRVLRLACLNATCAADLVPAAARTASAPGSDSAGRPSASNPNPRHQSRLTLAWNSGAPAVQGFVIERKSGDGEYRIVKRLPAAATTWVDEAVSAGTVYCYRVRSYGAAGGSEASTESCATAPSPDASASAAPSGAPALAPGSPRSGTIVALHDVAPLIGPWQGDVRTRSGVVPMTVVFKTDGTADWAIQGGASGTASFVLEGGRIRFRAAAGAATGSMFDDSGQRVLRFDCDDGTCSSELFPRARP